MFGAKCSLCNGKLDGRKICKECGLDNSKSEKYYKINRSSCDDLPLTHVHEEEWQEVKSIKKKAAPPKMAKYAYEAINKQNTEVKGTVEGNAIEEAIEKLKAQGLIVVSIKEQSILTQDINLQIGGYPTPRDLSIMCRQFVSMNKAGVTILLVEQNAQMALSIANRGYVLETGKVVMTADAKDLLNDDSVRKAYLGA